MSKKNNNFAGIFVVKSVKNKVYRMFKLDIKKHVLAPITVLAVLFL